MTPIRYSSLDVTQRMELKATSNFADYRIHKPYICCAWMDLHIDKDDIYNYEETPFKIKIVYIHPNAVLVHKIDGRYTITELKVGDIVKFNQLQMHGLLPRKLANLVVQNNRANVPGYKKWKTKIDGNAFKAKCIWEWAE
jgi:hypothetical protein